MILGDVIERNARLYPYQTAVVYEGRRYSHAEFAERVRRLANALCDRGLRRQDRVAILAQNCAEYLEVFGAGELAGFITATVNYRLAPPEIAYVLGDCAPAALVFEEQYADLIARLRPQLAHVRHFLCIGRPPAWAEAYEAALAAASPAAPPLRAGGDDTVYLIYTSGTSGRPKGVMLGQRGQVAAARTNCLEGSTEATDRVLLTMPLYHVGAKITQLAHHWRGCTVVLHRAFSPEAVLRTVQEERITATLLAPTMLRMLLDAPGFGDYDLSSLRTIVYSAAPMPVPLLRRALGLFGPIFMQYYGLTESGPMGTSLLKHHHLLDGPPEQVRRLASAGQACTGCEVRVVRPDGSDCAAGEPGEVLIRNESLMQGYWRNPAATAAALADGWLHTGDVGALDAEQFLFIVDRKHDLIVSGGENIYPREVEVALEQHPAVAEAAVIGVPDDLWGEAVKAFVVLQPGAAATEAELIEHTRGLIASYKKPKSVEFVGDLPKLPNGKVRKPELRAPYWAGRERQVT